MVLILATMPRLDGIAATRAILDGPTGPRVAILVSDPSEAQAVAALRAGAPRGAGAGHRGGGPAARGTRSLATGGAVIGPEILSRLLVNLATGPPVPGAGPAADLTGLTDREREVLVLVAGGLTNTQIAGRLAVSETTVKTHVGHLLTKLGLRDRVQAVRAGVRVRPGPAACVQTTARTLKSADRGRFGATAASRPVE